MKRQIYAGLLALLSPILFMNMSGCSKECGFALCDLITEVALGVAAITVTAGQPFDVPNLIKNIPETVVSCQGDILETLSAGASESRLKIDFDQNGDGTFSVSGLDALFEVGGIAAGDSIPDTYSFSFDDPGVYRLINFTDVNNANNERNEENNVSAPENVISGMPTPNGDLNIKRPLIITVLPNPDFQYVEGEPRVRLLKRTVKYN